MFCPNCGTPDQKTETYCRRCGVFLPDFDKIKAREVSPEEHLKANVALNVLTGAASLTLAILLYAIFLPRQDTPVIIYVTAGFLIAMFAWQAQVFWRNLKLKKHFKRRRGIDAPAENEPPALESKTPRELLPEADFTDHVPPSVVERTTRKLKVKNN